jgi:DNA gyrase subunit B
VFILFYFICFQLKEKNMAYQALDAITAIQTRPGMYIGTTETPDHLATEIVDNALDELSNNFASSINVFINESDGSFWVSDNGRGLKIYDMELEGGEMMDSIQVLCTKLHSGSKFDLNDYEKLIGMHGVGLVAVNALSDWLMIRIRNNKKKAQQYLFQKGQLNKIETVEDANQYTTLVGFCPSKQYFDTIKFTPRVFAERLLLVQAKYPSSQLFFNNKEIPKIDFERFVRDQLQLNGEKIYKLYNKTDDKKLKRSEITIFATVVDNSDSLILGEVNLRLCEGTFIQSLQTELKKQIAIKIDKKFKSVSANQLLSGLRAFVSLTVPEPKFDSQTKVRMTLPIKKQLIDTMIDQIEWFVGQEEIIKTIESNLERKFFTKITKSSKKYKKQTSAQNKVKDCTHIPGDVIYILEGDSALGTLKQIRDTRTEAIFPLKGKVLNVESNSIERISKNREIQDLLEALGPKGNRRYKSAKIIADADVDGAHIVVLVLLLFQKYVDDMIKSGNVSVIIPPLHGANKGKNFFPIYTEHQMEKYKKEGYTIQRFKGLGEMSPTKLKPIIRSGFEYNVTWPENNRVLQNTISVVTDTQVKRAIMNSPLCSFDNIINDVIAQLKARYNTNQ